MDKQKELLAIIDLGDGTVGIKSVYTKRGEVLDLLLSAIKVIALSDDQPEPSKIITPSILDMRKARLQNIF